jgi:hypothetical protein
MRGAVSRYRCKVDEVAGRHQTALPQRRELKKPLPQKKKRPAGRFPESQAGKELALLAGKIRPA